jgi:tetratricopeptide (TPR) repeat protein
MPNDIFLSESPVTDANQRQAGVICPHRNCGRENPAENQQCEACGGALAAFSSLYFLPAFFYNEGLQAYNAGNAQNARAYWLAAAQLNRSDPAPLIVLGKLHAQQGELKTAVDYWLQALDIAPSHETALRCLFEAKKLSDAPQEKKTKARRHRKKRKA